MQHDIKALLAHIDFLERKLASLNQHHRCCLVAPVSPPLDNESDDFNSGSDGRLQIILERPEDAEPPKPRIPIQPWQKAADQLLEDLPPGQWFAQTEQLKLSKVDLNDWIIAHLCGDSTPILAQMCEQKATGQATGIFESARKYARGTKAARDKVTFFHQLQAFRELVFVSLCAVLELLGYPIDEINETMREWLSDSSDGNLRRLRRGAIWANVARRQIGRGKFKGPSVILSFQTMTHIKQLNSMQFITE